MIAHASRPARALSSLVGRPLFWIFILAALVGWPVVRATRRALPPPLPLLGQVEAFSLFDQDGREYGSAELLGRVWVGGAIATRCAAVGPASCRELGARMARVQHRARNLGTAFRMVSFAVEPAHDTPAALTSYASSVRHSPRTWSFVTGPPAALAPVLRGLRLEGHHGPVALVDTRMQVRGRYLLSGDGEVDRLLNDLAALAALGGR